MKIQITPLLCLLFAGLLTGCKKDDDTDLNADYIVFGKYAGMCAGENCVEVYKIENGTLYEDSGDTYPGDAPYPANYRALPDAQYNVVKDLATFIPPQLLNEPNGFIGTPDAYDQGGFVFEVKENGVVKFWRIDTNPAAIPSYLRGFNDTLRSYIDRISD